MPLHPGANFGPYRVIEPLGRGGMAAVYKAFEPGLDRYVALKVLPAHFLHDPDFAERFKREAKVIARLEHPNIVPIHAFGVDEEIPWMVMRLIAGGAVSDAVKKAHRGLPPARAVSILQGAAAALVYAHRHGVLHRDVKPQNILIDESDHVYLADFGIAKMVEGSVALTKSGMITGTPQYMSPEQARAEGVDAHTDTYALGIVAYELLTGRLPFTADTPVAVLMKHIMDPIPLVPPEEVPEPMMRAVLKALAKSPDDRWETPVAFTDALSAAIGMPLGTTLPAGKKDLPTVTIGGLRAEPGAPPDRPTNTALPSREETGRALIAPRPQLDRPVERITEAKGPARLKPKGRPRRQAAPLAAGDRAASTPSPTRELPRRLDSRLIFAAVPAVALVVLTGLAVWLWLRSSEPGVPTVGDRSPISTSPIPTPTSRRAPEAAPTPPAILVLGSSETGARVLVDGKDRGAAPARLSLDAGVYDVQVAKDGCSPWSDTMRLVAGKERRETAHLDCPRQVARATREAERDATPPPATMPSPMATQPQETTGFDAGLKSAILQVSEEALGRDISLRREAHWVPRGNGGECILLDGVDDFVDVSPSSELLRAPTRPYSIEADVRLDSLPRSHKFVVDGLADDQSGLRLKPGGIPVFKWVTTTGSHNAESRAPLAPGVWHRLRGEWRGEVGRLFVDGRLVAEETGGGIGRPWRKLKIGDVSAGGTGDGFFAGCIDNVSVSPI